jgi:hypothetical protein
VPAAALLEHRDRLAHVALVLVHAQHHDRVGQVAGVDRRTRRRADQVALRGHQEGGDAALVQVGQQLVQLPGQEARVGHRVQVAVEAVDHHHARAVALDRLAHLPGELPRRYLGRVDRADQRLARSAALDQRHPEVGHPLQQDAAGLLEREHRRMVAPTRGGRHVLHRHGRLARAGRPDQQRRGAPVDAAAQQRVQRAHAAGDRLAREVDRVPLRGQPREHLQAAASDRHVVHAAQEVAAAELDDLQVPQRRAVRRRALVQRDHAVRDALQLQVGPFGGAVVQQQHRAAAADEELLERQDLAAVAQRALRQQPQLGQRVEHQPSRAGLLDRGQHPADGLGQLDFRGRVHREIAVELAVLGDQLEDLDAVERPAVRARAGRQLVAGLGQRHVQARLAGAHAFEQVLQGQRGLAGAGVAVDEIEASRDQAPGHHFVQARNAGGGALRNVGAAHRSSQLATRAA